MSIYPSPKEPVRLPLTNVPQAKHSACGPTYVANSRVLHVINGEHYSGAERVQDLLAQRLPDFGFEVGFACVKPAKFPAARQCKDTPLYEMPMRFKFDARVIRRLANILRQGQYALVHAHTPRSALVARAAAAMARVPMVYHVHSPTARDTTHPWRNWLNSRIERLSLHGVAALITVSESLRNDMVGCGYCESKVFSVANGVPVPQRTRDASPPGTLWTLGMVALFRPRKGLEVLLEALARLKQAGVPVRLKAVGPFETSSYEADIKRQAARLQVADRIEWCGFTEDVNRELATMDLFVLPSLFGEGLPMVVLEAMAAGVPVVASRVEGIPEAVQDGRTGVLAVPGCPADFACCIQRVIGGDLDWHSLRTSAMRRHFEEFSDGRMASRVAEVYRQVLGPELAATNAL